MTQWLMVMEFVRGETFRRAGRIGIGPLAPPQAAHLCMQALDALAHAHAAASCTATSSPLT